MTGWHHFSGLDSRLGRITLFGNTVELWPSCDATPTTWILASSTLYVTNASGRAQGISGDGEAIVLCNILIKAGTKISRLLCLPRLSPLKTHTKS